MEGGRDKASIVKSCSDLALCLHTYFHMAKIAAHMCISSSLSLSLSLWFSRQSYRHPIVSYDGTAALLSHTPFFFPSPYLHKSVQLFPACPISCSPHTRQTH